MKTLNQIIKDKNHKISQDLVRKALDQTNDWYSEGVKENTIALLDLLLKKSLTGHQKTSLFFPSPKQ